MPPALAEYEPAADLSPQPPVVDRAALAEAPAIVAPDRRWPDRSVWQASAIDRGSLTEASAATAGYTASTDLSGWPPVVARTSLGQPPETIRAPAGVAAAGDFGFSQSGGADAVCQDGGGSEWRLWGALSGRFWFRGDYLMMWTNGVHLPPLVTTGANGALPQATILFGDQIVERDNQSGFRTTAGVWLDDCHRWDVEFDYFTLGGDSVNFSAGSDAMGNPLLARPIYNVDTLSPDRQLVSSPGVLSGSVAVNAHDYFQSAGVLLSYNLCCCNRCCTSCGCGGCESSCGCGAQGGCGERAAGPCFGCSVELLGGYRFYNLSDSVTIGENLLAIAPPITNVGFLVTDSFRTNNEFHGGDLGVRARFDCNHWFLELLGQLAVGDNCETTTIGGQTVITAPGQAPVRLNGGLLALGTNSGTYVRDSFTMIPQLELNLGYQFTCHWSAHAGYDLLYWGTVQRAADQISLDIDPNNVPPVVSPGSKFPVFPDKTSSFWAEGFNVGTEYRF
jgi:hypothetical protein